MRMPPAKSLRLYAALMIVPVTALSVSVMIPGQGQRVLAHGPLLEKHDGLACSTCHLPALGSTRQQIQAELRHMVGLRQTPVDFGYQPVRSDQCLHCHARANERHPIYQFQEPRFRQALTEVAATSCLGCHSEHGDVKIHSGSSFCSACHDGLALKTDPLDVSHVTLIRESRWDSCMGCHDFHGNHGHNIPDRIENALPIHEVQAYLRGGHDPYGAFKYYRGATP